MRLAVWSPLPPSTSGIADYAAEQAQELARHVDLSFVVEEPAAVAPELARRHRLLRPSEAAGFDLDLYQLGNSPEHGYVYRAALARPGVLLLHDWVLHDLVAHETLQRGERLTYLREMRRAYGEAGSFVGRQVALGLGGELLPARFPLNQRVLDSSLGVIGLSGQICARIAERLPRGRPLLQLPHHLCLPLDPAPQRLQARRALGLPEDALLLTAPGLATRAKRLDLAVRAVARLRPRYPRLRLVVAGAVEHGLPLAAWARDAGVEDHVLTTGRCSIEDFARQLAAADVIHALRFPSRGEVSGALLRALGTGRAALVSAQTPLAEDLPDGLVAPIDPGPDEEAQLVATLELLLGAVSLRETMGRLARQHVLAHHGLARTAETLAGFLSSVAERSQALRLEIASANPPQGSLLDALVQEVRYAAFDAGLGGSELALRGLLGPLVEAV